MREGCERGVRRMTVDNLLYWKQFYKKGWEGKRDLEQRVNTRTELVSKREFKIGFQ